MVSKADTDILPGPKREQGALKFALQLEEVLLDSTRNRRAGYVCNMLGRD